MAIVLLEKKLRALGVRMPPPRAAGEEAEE